MQNSGSRAIPHILVVDDHDIVRHGVRTLLERSRPTWDICGEATNGDEAIAAVKALRPSVVVLDITMPTKNGIDVTSEITKLGCDTRVLIFTMHESERLVNEVREAGAHGYVLKSHAGRDLVSAIENLLSWGTFFAGPSATERTDTLASAAVSVAKSP